MHQLRTVTRMWTSNLKRFSTVHLKLNQHCNGMCRDVYIRKMNIQCTWRFFTTIHNDNRTRRNRQRAAGCNSVNALFKRYFRVCRSLCVCFFFSFAYFHVRRKMIIRQRALFFFLSKTMNRMHYGSFKQRIRINWEIAENKLVQLVVTYFVIKKIDICERSSNIKIESLIALLHI